MEIDPILDALAVGVAVVCQAGIVVWINASGAGLLGAANPHELIGAQGPFEVGGDPSDSGAVERTVFWDTGQGDYRVVAYQVGALVSDGVVVSFRDVTEQVGRQERVAALARTAAATASERSIATVLDAMAREVQRSEGVAGTQFITVSPVDRRLQVMGSAGFDEVDTFFELLMASHERGATLATFEVMDSGRQIVYPDRKATMLADQRWQPLHAYISQLEWQDFVSTPLIVRGRGIGVLNVYMEPNFQAGPVTLDFFTAMAEQASLALDYSTLLERDRIAVRRDERKKLARDLHDSVVQQVFSIGMQSRALGTMAEGLPAPMRERIAEIADDIADSSKAVQQDLRGIVLALQPSVAAEIGLRAALQLLIDKISRNVDIRFTLVVSALLPETNADFVEDAYHIVAESIYNAVKHATPENVSASIAFNLESNFATIDVVDDGVGPGSLRSITGGYGLTSMRERVARWSGQVDITENVDGAGTRVHARLSPSATRRGTVE